MVAAVIVAAGKGIRMQDPLRKQYLPLAGLPILAHTLTVFNDCDLVGHIYLVIPQDDIDFCRENILGRIKPVRKVHLVAGGARAVAHDRWDMIIDEFRQKRPQGLVRRRFLPAGRIIRARRKP